MVNAAVRKAIESIWFGRCTITQSKEKFNYVTKQTSFEDEVVCEDEPCRLSHESSNHTMNSDTVATVTQTIKLFIRPELVILAGSKIEVTQNGRTKRYIASGEPSIYSNHQEVVLTIEGDKA